MQLAQFSLLICLSIFTASPTIVFAESVVGPGGVILDLDQRLKFPLSEPSAIPLIHDGKATLDELIKEGQQNWFYDAQLEGEPFGISERITNFFFGKPGTPKHERLLEKFARLAGLIRSPGDDYPRGLVRLGQAPGVITQNCNACHSGQVNGHFIPGIANKFYDQRQIIKNTRRMMEISIPFLKTGGEKYKELLKDTEIQYKKLRRYEDLYGIGCDDLAPGMVTGARIWQISSKLLHDPEQLKTEEGRKKFLCGSSKAPPLNALRFRNIFFWDGTVNTDWVAHWPMFDFFGFDDLPRWQKKIKTRAIQAIDAFLNFGTKSPPWHEIMTTPIDTEKAARGYTLFHRANSCVSCHGSYSATGMLQTYKPRVIALEEIRTDSERSDAAFNELMAEFAKYGWVYVPRIDGLQKDYPKGYMAYPLCSTYLNYPYLHTAAVASLAELLLPEEQRKTSYWLSNTIDEANVGLYTSIPPNTPPLKFTAGSVHRKFRKELSNGHSGERYGTTLAANDRTDLLEYLKTLTCPDTNKESIK